MTHEERREVIEALRQFVIRVATNGGLPEEVRVLPEIASILVKTTAIYPYHLDG